MARPKADTPPAAAILALVDGGRLPVTVTPGARGEALEIVAGQLHAKVRARPKDGEANEAVLALLARALGVAPSRLAVLRGATSRAKLIGLDQG